MRLGGYFNATSAAELPALCDKLDVHGLSAIGAPIRADMTDAEAADFGDQARALGLVVGETGMWENLMTADRVKQQERIDKVRGLLRKAEIMGCHCVVSLVGTRDASDHPLAPSPHLFTKAGEAEFREVVLRILDGLDLKRTRYAIEPWHNTFFYQPERIKAFIDRVDHPRFGLHLDQMNMINQEHYYNTTALINQTFDLLADRIVAVHLKDLRCDFSHMFLKWDEVTIGNGIMDYDTYLKRLAQLPSDTPCYCEHMAEERDYALNFARLHHLASKAGVQFRRRRE